MKKFNIEISFETASKLTLVHVGKVGSRDTRHQAPRSTQLPTEGIPSVTTKSR